MGDAFQQAESGLARAILDYLQTHPNAADSVEGIARWWLGASGPEPDAGQLAQVLDSLAAQGRIRRTVLVDGTTLYGAAPRADPP